MTPEQFTYWLQGFVELHGEAPSHEQWESIKAHLALVFTKVTPPNDGKTYPLPPYAPFPWPDMSKPICSHPPTLDRTVLDELVKGDHLYCGKV